MIYKLVFKEPVEAPVGRMLTLAKGAKDPLPFYVGWRNVYPDRVVHMPSHADAYRRGRGGVCYKLLPDSQIGIR